MIEGQIHTIRIKSYEDWAVFKKLASPGNLMHCCTFPISFQCKQPIGKWRFSATYESNPTKYKVDSIKCLAMAAKWMCIQLKLEALQGMDRLLEYMAALDTPYKSKV